jgi:hypothetical protein
MDHLLSAGEALERPADGRLKRSALFIELDEGCRHAEVRH